MKEFIRNENGLHQIGGEIPKDLKIPENKFISNFQYLGFLNNESDDFNWLPFKLNLICPIYLDIDLVYLDYSNHLEPKIIHPKNTNEITSAFDIIDINSRIVYEATKVTTTEFNGVDKDEIFEGIGILGKPYWEQEQEVPICPISKRKMQFVCQLGSFGEIKTKYTNVVSKDPFEQEYFNKMNFWCDGNLYVYIEPETKIVCYFIQNT